jgi:protein tyrosine/serine phosphatase
MKMMKTKNKKLLIFFWTVIPFLVFADSKKKFKKIGRNSLISTIVKQKEAVDNFHTVEEGKLYRSALLPAKKLKKYVRQFGIKTIVNLKGESKDNWWQQESYVAQQEGAVLYNILMKAADPPSKESLKQLLDVYHSAPRPILIHCSYGINRTGRAATLWVLDQQSGTKEQAKMQLNSKYGYTRTERSVEYFLIEKWQGREWALQLYDPQMYYQYLNKE